MILNFIFKFQRKKGRCVKELNRERKNYGENTAVAHTKTNENFKKRRKRKKMVEYGKNLPKRWKIHKM